MPNRSNRHGLLIAPTYGYGEPFPRRPALRELCVEWIDAVAFWRDRSRLLPAQYAAYHLATFGIFILFFTKFFSLTAVLAVMATAFFIATVYNAVWYHRYCTHRAFKFRTLWLPRLFLWTNPVCFREESYVIPHRKRWAIIFLHVPHRPPRLRQAQLAPVSQTLLERRRHH